MYTHILCAFVVYKCTRNSALTCIVCAEINSHMDVDPFSDAKTSLSQAKPLELCRESAVTRLDYHIASAHDLDQCPGSPIPLDIDSEGSDTGDEEYVASKFECCLQEIEAAIVNRVTLLERSKIYLDELKNLHNYMLLPTEKFDAVDNALGELLECTFPHESGINCHPVAPYTAMWRTEDEHVIFQCAEKQFIVALHKNEYVCKSHTCRLPKNWAYWHY